MHPAIDKLVNFAPEERTLVERLLRPHSSTPDESLDNSQLLGFLSQVNAARMSGQPITRQVLLEAGLLAPVTEPAVTLCIAS